MLRLSETAYRQMVGHAWDALPDEACGLMAGPAGSSAAPVFYPCGNAAASSKLYTIEPRDHLRADRDAEARDYQICGVMHSHTHTDAYPSPTDVAEAPDPSWHYVIVSMRDDAPVLRSFRIVDGNIAEEAVVVEGR